MKKIVFGNLIYNLVMCLLIALVGVPLLGPSVYALCVLMFLWGFMPVQYHYVGFRNEVIKTAFTSDLQEMLWPDDSFYASAQSDTGIAIDAEKVEIPQDEDGEARTVVNPTEFPLKSYVEEDKKKSYELDLVATLPQVITDLNQALVSYDKRAAKLRKHANTLKKDSSERIMYGWSPTKEKLIRRTSGSSNRPGQAPGATGNRKRVSKEDILWAFSLFNSLNIPMENRRALFPAYMYEDLLLLGADFTRADAAKEKAIFEKGAVGIVFGFQVFLRSHTQVYTGDGEKKAIGSAVSGSDNQSVLFWHPQMVRFAKGDLKVYLNPEQGQFLGGTLNAALRTGGTISRLSETGVAALVEDNS